MFSKGFFSRVVKSRDSVVVPYNLQVLTALRRKSFENIVGKGENAGNQHFLLFPAVFSSIPKTNFIFFVVFVLSSANAFSLDKSKN